MLNLKKTLATLGATLMLAQGISGLVLQNDRAEAVTYKPAVQGLMSRPYPIVFGNQFHSNYFPDSLVNYTAQFIDIVAINNASSLFCENKTNADIARKIKAKNPNVKVLQYLNLMDVYTNTQAYYWMKSNNAFLRDDNGNPVHPYASTFGTNRWAGDSTKSSWQDYWASHAKWVADQGFDGIFSDNWFRTNAQGWKINSTRFNQIVNGWNTIGSKTKSRIGSKILAGNSPAWPAYTSRDINMIEGRLTPDSGSFNSFLKMADDASRMGQACFNTIPPITNSSFTTSASSILTFSLPATLMTDAIYGIPNNGGAFDMIAKVGKIGYPKGPRYVASSVMQRDFSAGKAIFNNTSSTRTVTLPSGVYKDVYGASKNSVTLSPFRGIVLKRTGTTTGSASPTPTTTSGVPAAPSNFTITSVTKGATTGLYYVNVSWKDNSNNESGFKILHSVNSTTSFSVIKTPAANTGSYGISLGTSPASGTHYFKIVAYNSSGDSPASNTVSKAF